MLTAFYLCGSIKEALGIDSRFSKLQTSRLQVGLAGQRLNWIYQALFDKPNMAQGANITNSAWPLLFFALIFKTIQRSLTTKKKLLPDKGRRSIEFVFKLVGCQDFQFVRTLENNRGAITTGEINSISRSNRRRVDIGNARQASSFQYRFT